MIVGVCEEVDLGITPLSEDVVDDYLAMQNPIVIVPIAPTEQICHDVVKAGRCIAVMERFLAMSHLQIVWDSRDNGLDLVPPCLFR